MVTSNKLDISQNTLHLWQIISSSTIEGVSEKQMNADKGWWGWCQESGKLCRRHMYMPPVVMMSYKRQESGEQFDSFVEFQHNIEQTFQQRFWPGAIQLKY